MTVQTSVTYHYRGRGCTLEVTHWDDAQRERRRLLAKRTRMLADFTLAGLADDRPRHPERATDEACAVCRRLIQPGQLYLPPLGTQDYGRIYGLAYDAVAAGGYYGRDYCHAFACRQVDAAVAARPRHLGCR